MACLKQGRGAETGPSCPGSGGRRGLSGAERSGAEPGWRGARGNGALPETAGERNTCEGNTPAAGGEGGKEKREGWRESPSRAGSTGERRRRVAGRARGSPVSGPPASRVASSAPRGTSSAPRVAPSAQPGGGRSERTSAGLRAPSPLSCARRSAGSGRQRNLRRGGSERCPRPRSVSGSPPACPGAGLSRGCRLRDG